MGEDLHQLEIAPAEEWEETAAEMLAAAIQHAVDQRGRCLMGVSGGTTSADVFDHLAALNLDWERVVLVQLDERIAPLEGQQRFVIRQQEAFADLPVTWIGLPVDDLVDFALDEPAGQAAVARAYQEVEARLATLADDPPMLDLIQLGLGRDGHTVSLFAGDEGLEELRRPVALTGEHQGYRRLTLTRPVLDRARLPVWLVRGEGKARALGRLLAGDLTMPAGLVRAQQSVILADTDAARQQ